MNTRRVICVATLSALLVACGNSEEAKSSDQTGGETSNGGQQTGGVQASQGGSGPIGGSMTSSGSLASGGTSPAAGGTGTGATSTGSEALGGASTGGSAPAGGGVGGIVSSGGSDQGGSGGTAVANSGTGGSTATSDCDQDAGNTPEFGNWPADAEPVEVGKLVAANYVTRPLDFEGDGGHNYVTYPESLAWYGSLVLAKLTDDQDLAQQLVDKFDPLLTAEGSQHISMAADVDYRIFGIVPLEIYLETQDNRYLTVGQNLADLQWQDPTNGITGEARYWADDMYMIAGLQVQAYRATNDTKYLDRTAQTLSAYISKLQQASSGFFGHTTETPIHWARANGWAAAGMVELLRVLPTSNSKRAKVLASYQMLMAGLLEWQRDDGLWGQVIDNADAWSETSATALFTYAIATGVANCWLDSATYAPVARKAWLGLVDHLDAQGNLTDVCVGTGSAFIDTNSTDPAVQMQYYLDRPRAVGDLHGQALLLWAAASLL